MRKMKKTSRYKKIVNKLIQLNIINKKQKNINNRLKIQQSKIIL